MGTFSQEIQREIKVAGFEPDRPRQRVVQQIIVGKSALALRADEYLTEPFIEFVRIIAKEKEVRVINFSKPVTVEEILQITGIIQGDGEFKPEAWKTSGAYLVALNFGQYILDNQSKLGTDPKVREITKLLRIAQKYGNGVMITYKGNDHEQIMDIAAAKENEMFVNYPLWDLAMECAEDALIK